jgi:hypothetical protein
MVPVIEVGPDNIATIETIDGRARSTSSPNSADP